MPTVTVLSRQSRGAGRYTSPQFTLPANLADAIVQIDATAWADGTLMLTLEIEFSSDNGQTWERGPTVGIVGGARDKAGNLPWVGINPAWVGKLMRVHFSYNQSATVGLRLITL